MRALSHDHDYCNKMDCDFDISEFFPELDIINSFVVDDESMAEIVQSIMVQQVPTTVGTAEVLQPGVSFMDTFMSSLPVPEETNPDACPSVEPSSPSQSVVDLYPNVPSTSSYDVDVQQCFNDNDTVLSSSDAKYFDRRRKNNAASHLSRLSRKQKAIAVEDERKQLEARNEYLKNELVALERLRDELKQKFMLLVTDGVKN